MASFTQTAHPSVKYREFDDFTRLPNNTFKFIGYDFLDTSKSRWQKWALHLLFLISLGSNLYNNYYMIKYVIEWEELASNIVVLMRFAALMAFAFNTNVKIITFLLNRQRIRNVLYEFKRLYPATAEQRSLYRVNVHHWPKAMLYIIIFYFVSTSLIALVPILLSIYVYLVQLFTLGFSKAKYPYLRGYPMEYGFSTTGLFRYLFAYFLELLHSAFMVCGGMGTDLWIICLVAQLCMHFEYVGRILENYEPDISHDKEDCEFLKELIRKHQHLLRLHKQINSIFGGLLVYNLLSTAGVFCACCVYVLVRGFSLETLSYVMFLLTATAQFYLVCHYGQLLITLSEYLAFAGFKHPWYNASMAYKKLLLIMMLRAGNPATLSAMGFVSIELDTFKLLLGMTYRVFTVLRNMFQ